MQYARVPIGTRVILIFPSTENDLYIRYSYKPFLYTLYNFT